MQRLTVISPDKKHYLIRLLGGGNGSSYRRGGGLRHNAVITGTVRIAIDARGVNDLAPRRKLLQRRSDTFARSLPCIVE